MILAIDIGGTKTLIAPCDNNGNPVSEVKFETPQKYEDFKKELAANVATITTEYNLVVAAVPGKLDRQKGTAITFGNLPWKNVPIQADIAKITNKKVLIENDANLAGLSEANRISPLPHRALYVTFSTGIGTGIVTNGVLDPEFLDSEGGNMLFEHNGKLEPWEKFASGKAIVAKYGKRASDLDDPEAWKDIAKWFAIGIIDLSSVLEPDVVIIGGGVGTHFKKYGHFLKEYIHTLTPKIVSPPKVIPAAAAEEAVIFGCAVLAKQHAKSA
jgi:predicted NBD/HSP70 family sugar kinase